MELALQDFPVLTRGSCRSGRPLCQGAPRGRPAACRDQTAEVAVGDDGRPDRRGQNLSSPVLKFLIDERLSVALVSINVACGHSESAHARRRGMSGWTDNRLLTAIPSGDGALLTRNSGDF